MLRYLTNATLFEVCGIEEWVVGLFGFWFLDLLVWSQCVMPPGETLFLEFLF